MCVAKVRAFILVLFDSHIRSILKAAWRTGYLFSYPILQLILLNLSGLLVIVLACLGSSNVVIILICKKGELYDTVSLRLMKYKFKTRIDRM